MEVSIYFFSFIFIQQTFTEYVLMGKECSGLSLFLLFFPIPVFPILTILYLQQSCNMTFIFVCVVYDSRLLNKLHHVS